MSVRLFTCNVRLFAKSSWKKNKQKRSRYNLGIPPPSLSVSLLCLFTSDLGFFLASELLPEVETPFCCFNSTNTNSKSFSIAFFNDEQQQQFPCMPANEGTVGGRKEKLIYCGSRRLVGSAVGRLLTPLPYPSPSQTLPSSTLAQMKEKSE
ncbi:hypothetical protein T10_3344 [Trichinella papuae]|uniref:Uncharacterized protein n=1 Tax=Trichinella papuae TaxID=268474 RepID=A0A0V1N3Y0_9BILA|nr:hypothetical protein T10_3344 [Trichinella papuae]